MDNDFQNAINKASRNIEAYTYPLLQVDDHGSPDIIASCLFLDVEGVFYLVTAAHALNGIQAGLLTRGNGFLIDVVGQATVSRSSGKDHFDIAAIKVHKDTIREHHIKVVRENMFISSVEVTNPHSRAVSGFLASMNKQNKILDKKDKILTAKCFTYFGYAKFDADFSEFHKSPYTHVGIEFVAGRDNSGKYLSTPPWPPRGISGGGAWLVPDLSRPDLLFLEGIFIESYKREKRMLGFSTHLSHVIDFIKQTSTNERNIDAAINTVAVS